ncbi:MAG TPA: TonB-dependent receptor [Edaphobacter sp.]|uniref:TonB-dependent receptor n=1 Tax=Edaphobacter sp. TaxID=1934404 RepID=UPI002C69273F|nr:TonB-dependent receptor [Edaphobacter sp.]HUZ93615.1 TonB-dependent receptor [Edaphobacter sp.]
MRPKTARATTISPKFMSCFVGLLTSAVLVFSGNSATAQTITGAIRGSVTGPWGAAVARATITATEVATGVKTSTAADPSGLYNFQFLPIGSYKITAMAPGFKTTSFGPLALEIDEIAQCNFTLQLRMISTTVNVSAAPSAIFEAQSATLGTTVTSNTIESLPLGGLNVQTAGTFVPGAVNPTYGLMGGPSGYERDTSSVTVPSFNGNRQQGNSYILDGVEINETLNNLIGYNPAPEAVQQMRVITADADAEYGDVNGGEIVMVTKRGTNQVHGSLYDYFEDQDLAANTWSNNYSGLPKGSFHQDQFGAAAGGPIRKNHLFIFGDYLGTRNVVAGKNAASVATAKMRTCTPNNGVTSCDFSELLTVNGIPLYNPAVSRTNPTGGYANASPYTDNQIPLNNPVASYLFAHPELYPMPNHAPSPGTVDSNNYQAPTKTIRRNNQGDVRVDYAAGSKDSLMFRYSDGDAYDITPEAVLPVIFPASNAYPFHSGVMNWVHTFSPSAVNQLRAGISRIEWNTGIPTDPSGKFGMSGDENLGIPFNQPFDGFSLINVSSPENNLGTAAIVTSFVDNDFNYADDLIWEHGKHITNAGVQITRYQQNSYYAGNAGAMGQFLYGGYYTQDPNVAGASGYGFADFVLDQSFESEVGGVNGPSGQRQYRDAYYVQDDWNLLPRLTLHLGLRYGYDQPIYEVNNKELNVNIAAAASCTSADAPSNPCLEFAGQNGNSRALYEPYYGEWMPRFGFAWQFKPRLVLRGGYGITDWLEGTGANLRLTQNAPFLTQFVNAPSTPGNVSAGDPLSVTSGFPAAGAASQTQYNAWARNLRPTAVQQFNLTMQYLIDSSTTAQVGYVGEIGRRLIVPASPNQWTVAGVPTSAPFSNLVGANGYVVLTESEGVENYNAMQAVFRHRSDGLECTLNYTWSKSLTNSPGFFAISGVDNNSVYWQDYTHPHADYGPSGFDTRQALNGTAVWQLPFGLGRSFGAKWRRAWDESFGGWKLSGDVVLYSGFPITMTSPNNANLHSRSARSNQYRPMRIMHRSVQHWFGTDPSANPCTGLDNGVCAYGEEQAGNFGTAHINTERAPGYRVVDLSLFKSFSTVESQALTLRVDAFNVGNIASYAAPAYTSSADGVSAANWPDNSLEGRITSTLSGARQLQLSLLYRF